MEEKYSKIFYPDELRDSEQLENVVEGYHSTSVDNLESIIKHGIVPRKGPNSQHEIKPRVYFSTTKDGLLYLMNRAKYGIYTRNTEEYDNLKSKDLEITLNNILEKEWMNNPLLKFDLKELKVNNPQYDNRPPEGVPGNRNTDEVIEPSRIRVAVLKDKRTSEISASFKDIISYIQGELKETDPERYKLLQIKEFEEYDVEKLKNTEFDTISLEQYMEFSKDKNGKETTTSKFMSNLKAGVKEENESFTENNNMENSRVKENHKER